MSEIKLRSVQLDIKRDLERVYDSCDRLTGLTNRGTHVALTVEVEPEHEFAFCEKLRAFLAEWYPDQRWTQSGEAVTP